MAEMKEPLYMKWWVWVIIFLVTAVIVNYTAEIASDYLSKPSLPDAEIIPYQVDVDEVKPVMANDQIPITFLTGTDFPAGEYFVMAGGDKLGYVLLTRSRNLETTDIIWQKHFENHAIINLHDGQYLTVKNATLIPVENAIVPNFEDGILQAGTYRVGVDIPPGVFTLFPLDDQNGFFMTASSSHQLNSHVMQSQNFSEPVIIALNIGDYFSFMRAQIRK